MNRVFGTCFKILSACAVCFCLSACDQQVPPASSPPAPAALAQYVISGGVSDPGPRILAPGDTVAMVIAHNLPPSLQGRPTTICLVRRDPEGKTRQLIQLDANGKLMDEKQNSALRNGDELVFPGGKGSDPTGRPMGAPPRVPE